MKKKNFVIIIALAAITIWAIYSNSDPKSILNAIKGVNLWYIGLGFVALGIYEIIEAYLINELMNKICNFKNIWLSLKITIIGQYYSLITPCASGGQPAQAHYMYQRGLSLGKSSSVLLNKFIVYQVSVTIYSMILLIVKFKELTGGLHAVTMFIMFGLLVNTIGLSIIIGIAYKKELVELVFSKSIIFFHKIKVIKDIESAKIKSENYVREYSSSISVLGKDYKMIFKMIILSFIQLTAYFAIAYFVYLSLGLSGGSIIHIVSLSALLYMSVSFVPIPGTLGAGEVGFTLLFASVFPHHLLAPAMILWRVIGYYGNLALSGFMTILIYMEKPKNYIKDAIEIKKLKKVSCEVE